MAAMSPRDVFEILMREHSDMLTIFLRAAVRDPHIADDLFQETMLVAWKNLDRFDRSRPFGPWLRGIAGKLVLAHRRGAFRNGLEINPDVLNQLEERVAHLARRPGDTLDDKIDDLRECLDRLPEHYRLTVRLRYAEGFKGEELARKLETSLENVKKRLQRGREKLFECLSEKLARAKSSS